MKKYTLVNTFAEDYDCIEWEDFINELTSKFKNDTMIVRGTVKTWQGIREAGKIIDVDAFDWLLRETDDYEIFTDDRGHLFFHGVNHDGGVYMEIKILTPTGYEANWNWNNDYGKWASYSDWELIEKLWENNFYSKLPHMEA